MIHVYYHAIWQNEEKKSCTSRKIRMVKHVLTLLPFRNIVEQQLIDSDSNDFFLNNRLSEWQKQPYVGTLSSRRKSGRRTIRSQDEIEAAILDSCRTPIVQHWIMVKARLGLILFGST
jgi:hypothetical protein